MQCSIAFPVTPVAFPGCRAVHEYSEKLDTVPVRRRARLSQRAQGSRLSINETDNGLSKGYPPLRILARKLRPHARTWISCCSSNWARSASALAVACRSASSHAFASCKKSSGCVRKHARERLLHIKSRRACQSALGVGRRPHLSLGTLQLSLRLDSCLPTRPTPNSRCALAAFTYLSFQATSLNPWLTNRPLLNQKRSRLAE